MSKTFSLIFIFLLAFPLTACGQSEVGETGAAEDTETIPEADTTESAGETGTVPNHTGCEPTAGEETIVKAEFDFEKKTVMLNSGYEIPDASLESSGMALRKWQQGQWQQHPHRGGDVRTGVYQVHIGQQFHLLRHGCGKGGGEKDL